ncbi:MAG: hypothetical protein C5B58_00385 [Acidobacteria bacterium]|nr:MAG: hypothetical protein C5B58_00385 [Acidobacteriota bacterium]
MSHRELVRLFRRATIAAQLIGERADTFRARLSEFLRELAWRRRNAAAAELSVDAALTKMSPLATGKRWSERPFNLTIPVDQFIG